MIPVEEDQTIFLVIFFNDTFTFLGFLYKFSVQQSVLSIWSYFAEPRSLAGAGKRRFNYCEKVLSQKKY